MNKHIEGSDIENTYNNTKRTQELLKQVLQLRGIQSLVSVLLKSQESLKKEEEIVFPSSTEEIEKLLEPLKIPQEELDMIL